ncbi:MAG: hypothetical protein ACD_34C00501G0002 [uncultured bacterium]|nr:MAG: hypothetical protein ACD_34C00501G0002 [uncultured bacterium]
MKISKPKKVTWWIAVIAGAAGIIGTYVAIPVISGIAFWLVAGAFILLALACIVDGL